MLLWSDLKILYQMALKPIRGADHAQRLDSFYSGQAAGYDDFRRRLLQGREDLWQRLDAPEGGVWVDFGGGTGSNLEHLGPAIARLRKVYVVDLATSLLDVARKRITERNWTNAEAVCADATEWSPSEGAADVVTFSYSLTMIPDWFAAMENARRILRPGGRIGIVDFYVSRKYPPDGHVRHGWFTRSYWPVHFALDNVFLSQDHVAYLEWRFASEHLGEHRAKVPYIPFMRVPYYVFVGRKPGA